MIVKTNCGKVGRIARGDRGNLKIKVEILNENLHPMRDRKGNTVIEYFHSFDLIYNPKIIVER